MTQKKNLLKLLLFLGDIFLMNVSLFLAITIRQGEFIVLMDTSTRMFFYNFSFVFLIWTLFLYIFDFYKTYFFNRTFDFLKRLTIFIFLGGLFGMVYFYLRPELIIAPKTVLLLAILIFGFLFTVFRYLVLLILKSYGFKEKAVAIGLKQNKNFVKNLFEKGGYNMSGYFSLNSKNDFLQLKNITEQEKISIIVFGEGFYKNQEKVKKVLQDLPFKFSYINFVDFYENIEKKIKLEEINEIWVLENLSREDRKIEQVFKNIFDVLFSGIGVLFFTVLFPLIALAIEIDSKGPIFYVQERVGKNRKIFNLYKFRTMAVSENQHKEIYREKKPDQVTRVGKILRKIHLDELPQVLNIFKGDVSFVGPRPEWLKLVEVFEKKIPFYSLRHLVKPGIVGWAQINFPASTSLKEAREKFEYDLYYIRNRSFFLDILIMLKSIKLLFE